MTYTTLARCGSSSSDAVYEVATEGTQLSCNCPGWTRQTHYRDCPAITAGRSCTCRSRNLPREPKDARVCKHTRDIDLVVRRLGGLALAIRAMSTVGDIRYAVGANVGQLREQAHPQPVREDHVRRPAPERWTRHRCRTCQRMFRTSDANRHECLSCRAAAAERQAAARATCEHAGCRNRRVVGSGFCATHQPRPASVRQRLQSSLAARQATEPPTTRPGGRAIRIREEEE